MSGEVPARARELAAGLSVLFERDVEIARRLHDAQRRLLDANDQLWSGSYPDALGLIYDGAAGVGAGESAIAGRMAAALNTDGGRRPSETRLLEARQRAHRQIQSAFWKYQSACEERRQLAVDVGELAVKLTDALCAAGWTEQDARRADVHELAGGRR